MDDFIFGSLSTDELRVKQYHNLRGGVTHNSNRLPRDPLPGQPVKVTLTLGPSFPQNRAFIYWTNDGTDPEGTNGQPSNGYTTALKPVSSEWDTLVWGYVRRFEGEIPAQAAGTVVRYFVSVSGKGDEVVSDQGTHYAYYVDNDPPPAWTRDAVLYQIFVDRFYSSAPNFPRIEKKPSLKCNGTLRGITEKLDYLAELGINCLWLTPVFPSPSYHGYDSTSFFEINPRLGTKEDFKELLDGLHARGMRFIMDFVPNHWSNDHQTFVEAVEDRNSQYIKWYTFDKWPNEYKTFFGVRNLPQINLRYKPARDHVLDAAKYWLEFGVDGFRVDYCIGPSPDFYAEFRRVTRTTKPDSWTFGEAVDPPDSQLTFEGGMDGALDFLMLEALRQTFGFGKWSAQRFAEFLDRHEEYYPADFSRPSFLDNHDMNRFLWSVQNDKRKLRLAALCQFTLIGAPIIYYGSEVGLSQERDVRQNGRAIHEETRMPMLWGDAQDKDLFAYHRALCELRKQESALRYGTRETIYSDEKVLAYRRADSSGSLVSVMNISDQAVTLSLDIAENVTALVTSFECKAQAEGSQMRIFLPPYGGMVLKK